MVSMKDIAAKCNVSVATVSKAMNGHSDIGAATKEMIVKTAKEMGYFPNSSARALKTNRSYNLGVLFVDEAHNGLRQDYFSAMLDSFKVTAEAAGYDITFINCNKTKNKMTYLEHSKYRGVDGVIIACVNFNDQEVQELLNSDVPIVTIDYVHDSRIAVLSDNTAGMSELVKYIHSMGHQKIAYIHGADSTTTRNRLVGFHRTMDELGISVNPEYIIEGCYREPEIAKNATTKLLKLADRPTCIIYPDDYAAIGGINAIKEAGLLIPEDISVAGYDGIEIAKVLEPKLTTLEQNTEAIGARAAKSLIELIENPKTTEIEKFVVKGVVLEGSSVKKL